MEIKKYLTQRNFNTGYDKKNKFIVIHYTANNGDTALNNCKYFSTLYRGASANYFVDENDIYQCVDDMNIAWHVGASKYYNDCRNNNSIGIELCSRKENGKYYFKDETIKNAQWLVKELMKKYDIPIENVVRHYDVTHKICPEPFVTDESKWEEFKKGLNIVDEKMGYVVYNKLEELPDWAYPSVQKAINVGVLKGTGNGLGLTQTEVKMIVWLDRCKCLDFCE